MLIPTIIMGALAAILFFIGYSKGEGQHILGMKSALKMTIEILPLLAFAFIVAGMIQVLLPGQLISKWVGAESGVRGILIGTVAGGLSPGGPFVSLPVALGLLRAGASVGTMVAFLTGWSLWAFSRLPMEIGILGWKFTAIRLASTFFFPPIAGLIAQVFFGEAKLNL
ncbi:permease [bacterium]|nr:permease [bacterium]MBU1614773.1 permease [bacterium]